MRKVLFIILSAVLMTLAASCGQSRVSRSLSHVEEIMEEHPDSALAILDSLPAAEIKSDADRALHALLLTQAQIKNGYTVDSDTLIRRATAYYSDRDPSPRLMKSLFYLGDILHTNGNLPESIIVLSEAYTLANKFDDSYWIAKTSERISDIYNDSYNVEEAIRYTEKAVHNYSKSGKLLNHLYSLCDLATGYSNKGIYDRAEIMLDSVASIARVNLADTALLAYCYDSMLPVLMKSKSYDKANICLDSISKISSYFTKTSKYYGYKAALELERNNYNKTSLYLDSARLNALDESDKALIAYITVDLNKKNGRYDEATLYADSLSILQDKELRNAVRQAVATSQRDYYNQTAIAESQRSERLSTTLLIGGIVFCLIVVSITVIYHLMVKIKDSEIESRMRDILILSERIKEQDHDYTRLEESLSQKIKDIDVLNSKVKEQEIMNTALMSRQSADGELSELKKDIESLYRVKWNTLNILCNQYFEKKDSEQIKATILNDVEKEIKKFQTKRSHRQIEDAVNRYMDDIIKKLRSQCSFLKEENIVFISMIYAGLSPRAICIFTDISLTNYYTKKQRLTDRISKSDAQDRQLFISKLSK